MESHGDYIIDLGAGTATNVGRRATPPTLDMLAPSITSAHPSPHGAGGGLVSDWPRGRAKRAGARSARAHGNPLGPAPSNPRQLNKVFSLSLS